MYIIFEGTVGTGKTTQSKRLAEYLKNKFPKRKVVWTREPGSTEIAEAIRTVVQGTVFKENMDPTCEAYLYASARAQSLNKIVKPMLKNKNSLVIADRSFITSMSYQGYVRKLGLERVWKINEEAVKGFIPDLVIYMNLDPKIGLKRSFDKGGDKFEKEKIGFFKKADEGFKKVSKMLMFKGKWIDIDADGTEDEVFERIINKLIKTKAINL